MSNDPNFNNAQSPTQPLSNTPPAPAPNATPFDTHLVDDAAAPRYTQPLPNSTVTTGSIPVQTPRLPSQVVPNTDSATPNYFTPTPSGPLPGGTPNTAPTVVSSTQSSQPQPPLQSPTAHLPAARVPMTTLLGLAAVGGAILVAFGSSLVRRAVPTPPTTSTTIVETQRRNSNSSSAPAIVMKPSTGSSNKAGSSDTDSTSNESDIIIEPSTEESTNSGSSSVIREQNDESPRRSSSSSDNNFGNSGGVDEETDDSADAVTNGERVARVPSTIVERDDNSSSSSNDAKRETTSDRDDAERLSRTSSDDDGALSRSRYVERRREYSIQPPRDFRRTQSGRRTIWKGSGGAQILVEVAKNNGESPRAGWESLDRSLSKKYGRAYTSRGIRETTVNGRRAAVWEFDLQQKNGTIVRKMDVAVVDKNNGYAVLVSAPVENFERMRPTFERVVNSFRVGKDAGSAGSERNSDSDASPQGF